MITQQVALIEKSEKCSQLKKTQHIRPSTDSKRSKYWRYINKYRPTGEFVSIKAGAIVGSVNYLLRAINVSVGPAIWCGPRGAVCGTLAPLASQINIFLPRIATAEWRGKKGGRMEEMQRGWRGRVMTYPRPWPCPTEFPAR